MRKLLKAISGYLPCKIIKDGEDPYLERYYVATVFGKRVYLHRFVASDPDRGLHDHPWRWALSIILAGWYWENTRYGMRKVRWLNRLTGDTFHRVILHQFSSDPREVWTLFIHSASRDKAWGFLHESRPPFMVYKAHESSEQDAWWTVAKSGRFTPGRQP